MNNNDIFPTQPEPTFTPSRLRPPTRPHMRQERGGFVAMMTLVLTLFISLSVFSGSGAVAGVLGAACLGWLAYNVGRGIGRSSSVLSLFWLSALGYAALLSGLSGVELF